MFKYKYNILNLILFIRNNPQSSIYGYVYVDIYNII